MGKSFHTAASFTSAIISNANRKKAIREIARVNNENRNVSALGNVNSDMVIPTNTQMGNICISGGTNDVRNQLIIQNCYQNISIGMPTIIIHEGNHQLDHLLRQKFSNHRYMRVINQTDSFYEPIFRLNDEEIANLMIEAAFLEQHMEASANIYIKAVAKILRAKGIVPYIRMFSSCPFNMLPAIIDQLESGGGISPLEADTLRSDISVCDSARPSVECLFNQIQQEADILAWKSNLSRSTSVLECVRRQGLLVIDVTSCSRKLLLSLINAELKKCAQEGKQYRIILDAMSLKDNERLIKTLKSASDAVVWTFSLPDIYRFSGSEPGELTAWLAMVHRTILFSHGIQTSQKLAVEIGEYDHIEVVESHAGNHNIGQFGYHFGSNTNISTSMKREQIIKPEEIERLTGNEFILVDNFNSAIGTGKLI